MAACLAHLLLHQAMKKGGTRTGREGKGGRGGGSGRGTGSFSGHYPIVVSAAPAPAPDTHTTNGTRVTRVHATGSNLAVKPTLKMLVLSCWQPEWSSYLVAQDCHMASATLDVTSHRLHHTSSPSHRENVDTHRVVGHLHVCCSMAGLLSVCHNSGLRSFTYTARKDQQGFRVYPSGGFGRAER